MSDNNGRTLWQPFISWGVHAYRWLHQHLGPNDWSALGTWTTALIAVITVIVAGRYAKRQVAEARNQVRVSNDALIQQAKLAQESLKHDAEQAQLNRKHVSQPNVVVFIDHDPQNWQFLDLVIKNFGQTPAYNIKLTLPPLDVVPFQSLITGETVTELYVPKKIAVLAPGQEWRTVWDYAVKRKEYKGKLRSQFDGEVQFDDEMNPKSGKQPYTNPISLDTEVFRSMLRLSEAEPAKQIADQIAEVAKTLKSYQDDEDPVWVYMLPGEREHQRREDKRAEGRRKAKEAHDHIISQLTPEEQKQPRRKV